MASLRDERHRIDRRLLVRMGIFLAIGAVILAFTVYDVLRGDLPWWLGAAVVVAGLALGYGVGRLGRIRWHETEDKVISQMDIVGVVAILLYILLRLGSRELFSRWFTGTALSTATLALLGGALVGRYLGTRRSISRTLEQGRGEGAMHA